MLAVLAAAPVGTGVELAIDGSGITLAGRTAEALPGDFPRWSQLDRPESAHELVVDVAELRDRVRAAPEREAPGGAADGTAVSVLTLGAQGGYGLDGEEGLFSMVLDREFLLQALDASSTGQLLLGLDGPVAPLAIREPGRAGTFSLLMPIAP